MSKLSSSRRSLLAFSGENPLPTARTTSLALKSVDGSVVSGARLMLTPPPSLSMSSSTPRLFSMSFFIAAFGPIRTPTRFFGIFAKVLGLDSFHHFPIHLLG